MQTGCSENRVLPYLTMDDLAQEMFDKERKLIGLNRPGPLRSQMTYLEILMSAGICL